jgi:hypothetical protein
LTKVERTVVTRVTE